MINEAFFCLMEGVGSAEDIDKGMRLGTNQPMGPLRLADFIGECALSVCCGVSCCVVLCCVVLCCVVLCCVVLCCVVLCCVALRCVVLRCVVCRVVCGGEDALSCCSWVVLRRLLRFSPPSLLQGDSARTARAATKSKRPTQHHRKTTTDNNNNHNNNTPLPPSGLDTCLSIMNVLHRGIGDSKYRPCPLLQQYVDAGWLGQKVGRGIYSYDTDKQQEAKN